MTVLSGSAQPGLLSASRCLVGAGGLVGRDVARSALSDRARPPARFDLGAEPPNPRPLGAGVEAFAMYERNPAGSRRARPLGEFRGLRRHSLAWPLAVMKRCG